MRICAFIPRLGAGGAEKVIVGLSSNLAKDRHHYVTLITLDEPGAPSFFPVDPLVSIIGLDALGGSGTLNRLGRIAVRLVKIRWVVGRIRPDVLISFMDTMNITVLLATRGLGVPVIVSERVDPAAHHHRIGRLKSALRRLTYPWADRVVVQTRRAATFFADLAPGRLVVLPNPVAPAERAASPGRLGPDGRFRLIGVGRLDPQKGFDLLIEAFARVAADFPEWDLVIFGEGDGRPELSRRIAARGLTHRVRLPGVTAAIEAEYGKAHVLAFPSRYEGFPNVFAEAMATGLPTVAFKNVSGVEDLAVHLQTTLLAPHGDIYAYADHLATLMADPELRRRLGAAARDRIKEFSPTTVYAQWRRLVEEVSAVETDVHSNGNSLSKT